MACVSALASLVEISESDRTHRGMAFFLERNRLLLFDERSRGEVTHRRLKSRFYFVFSLFFFGLLLDIN